MYGSKNDLIWPFFNNGGNTLKLHARLLNFPISIRAETLKDRQDKLKQRYRKGNGIIMINDENASLEEGYLLLNLKYLRAVLDVKRDAS